MEPPSEKAITENRFWNVFVVLAGGGVVVIFDHLFAGLALIVLGVGGFVLSIWRPAMTSHSSKAWALALLLTWAAVAYDYYDRRTNASVVVKPFVKAWGSQPGSRHCAELFDGSALMQWSDKYNLAFICGLSDPTVDKFEDGTATVTPVFSIHPGDIHILVAFSKMMLKKEDAMITAVLSNLPKTTPNGAKFAIPENVWYEPILVPKTSKIEDIHKLSDVPRCGGVIISQGLPK